MNTSEVLNKAADLIEERGWSQGVSAWGDDSGALCIEGGIYAALGQDFRTSDRHEFESCPAYVAVMNYLEPAATQSPYVGDSVAELFFYNDDDARTAAEVIEVLRATAVIEAARESAAVPVSA